MLANFKALKELYNLHDLEETSITLELATDSILANVMKRRMRRSGLDDNDHIPCL